MRKVLSLALASAAFVGAASSASAANYVEAGKFFFGDDIAAGSFDHTFYAVPGLAFPSAGSLNSGVQTVALTLGGSDDIDFTGFYLVNLTQGTEVLGVKTTPTAFNEQYWVLGSVNATDRFALRVTGTSGGTDGGFNGSYTYTAYVPEPASWLMMVGGFGLMGAAMRRRTRTSLTFA